MSMEIKSFNKEKKYNCIRTEDGTQLCKIEINGARAEVEITPNGERRLIHVDPGISREDINNSIREILEELSKKSEGDEYGTLF